MFGSPYYDTLLLTTSYIPSIKQTFGMPNILHLHGFVSQAAQHNIEQAQNE